MDNSSATTWQKIAALSAILLVVVPVVASKAWNVLYPDHELIYSEVASATFNMTGIAQVEARNQGEERLDSVEVSVSAPSSPSKKVRYYASISSKSEFYSYREGRFFEIKPHEDGRFRISLGRLAPEEGVSLTLVAEDEPGEFSVSPDWQLSEFEVSSDQVAGKEASSRQLRAPGDLSFRSAYFEVAPYMLAAIAALIALLFAIGILYDLFFNSPQKQMTALWRQMDALQERIDKEKRYQ